MNARVDAQDVAARPTGRSRRRLLLVLLPMSTLVLALTVGTALYERSKPATPVAALQAHFDAEEDRNWSRVWDLTCEKIRREDGTRDDYVLRREGWSHLSPDRVPVITGAAQAVDTLPVPAWHVPVNRRDGSARGANHFLVIEEGGELRVCGRRSY